MKNKNYVVWVDGLRWAEFYTYREAKSFVVYHLGAFYKLAVIRDAFTNERLYSVMTYKQEKGGIKNV